jgi:thiosulfate sulfurtransferase
MTEFSRINTEQARQLISERGAVIVDIRDEQSYANGHMDNALLLGNHNITEFVEQADPDHPVIVVCYHGNSSQGAAQFLCEKGLEEVYSLDGGFEAWRAVK